MGGRRLRVPPALLLGVLALLGAAAGAGLPFTEPEELASRRPLPATTPQSPFPGRGPHPSAGTRQDPQDGSRVPVLPNTLLSASAERSGHPKGRESGAPAVEESQTSAEAPSGARTGEKPPTAKPPFVPARPTTRWPPWAFLPTSAPRKDPPGRPSGPASQGVPAAGVEGGGSEGWEPTTLAPPAALGSRGASARQAGWTGGEPPPSLQPGQEGAQAEDGAAASLSAGEWGPPATGPPWPPRPATATSRPLAQEAKGPLPRSTWQPLRDTTEPSPTKWAALPTASGPGRDVATGAPGRAQPWPHTGNTVLFWTESGVPWEQTVGHLDSGGLAPHLVEETSPSEAGTAVGRFSPGTALAPSPMPSSASHPELGRVGERTGSLGAPNPNLAPPSLWETEPPMEASSARERWGEPPHTGPFSPSSSRRETSLRLNWGSFRPSLADDPHELPASVPPPGEPFTPLPRSPAWHSAGQPSREDQAPLHPSVGHPAVVGAAPSPVGILPESSSAAPSKEGAPRDASAKPAGPGALTPRTPPRPTPGAAFATVAPPLTQTTTTWGGGLRTVATNSAKSPRPETATEGATWQAREGPGSRGSATETAEPPSSGSPWREGGSPGQPPAPAGPPASSAEATSSATSLVLSADRSSPPEFRSERLAFSDPPSEAVAALTRATGGTVAAPNLPSSARHHAWTSSARTWSWEGGDPPRRPTESLRKEKIQQSPGAARTTAALLSESPSGSGGSRSRGHPWPPKPTPEQGSRREGPRRATTWLSAAGPEEATPQLWPTTPREGHPRGHSVFVVENQPPLLKAAFLHIPCELVLAMEFSRSLQDPESPEYRSLARSLNETVTPLFASLPGFQRLEVKAIRSGGVVVVVEFDALFRPQVPGLWAALRRSPLSERLPPGLWVANASVLRSATQERRLDPCAVLFSCHAGYECLAEEDGGARCVSLCHRDYCKNQGICTHVANHTPVCQCPVGHDFWFLGVHCDYKVTQQGLLGVAGGLLLSLVVLGGVVAGLVMRRVRLLLLEARADQTKSSYRRFCRLDDVSAHYWSEPWLASTTSLDNPAFSNSEELLHLQILEPACYGCQEDCGAPDHCCRRTPDAPRGICAAGQPSSRSNWAESTSSVNDPMVDSGKASEVSFSSWPMEPIQWSPFPAQHKLPRDQAPRAPRPNSCCEGMELVNLERSWTA
ncbi:uncharacterized protein LOC110085023 [Pogona vitticeps]